MKKIQNEQNLLKQIKKHYMLELQKQGHEIKYEIFQKQFKKKLNQHDLK
jgi:hypothetical protein